LIAEGVEGGYIKAGSFGDSDYRKVRNFTGSAAYLTACTVSLAEVKISFYETAIFILHLTIVSLNRLFLKNLSG
jgi:hypothetical protein